MKKKFLSFIFIFNLSCFAAGAASTEDEIFKAINDHDNEKVLSLIKMNANLNVAQKCLFGPDQTPLDAALYELFVNNSKIYSSSRAGLSTWREEEQIENMRHKSTNIENIIKLLLYAGAYFNKDMKRNDAISEMLPPFVEKIEESTKLCKPLAKLIVHFLFNVEVSKRYFFSY